MNKNIVAEMSAYADNMIDHILEKDYAGDIADMEAEHGPMEDLHFTFVSFLDDHMDLLDEPVPYTVTMYELNS